MNRTIEWSDFLTENATGDGITALMLLSPLRRCVLLMEVTR